MPEIEELKAKIDTLDKCIQENRIALVKLKTITEHKNIEFSESNKNIAAKLDIIVSSIEDLHIALTKQVMVDEAAARELRRLKEWQGSYDQELHDIRNLDRFMKEDTKKWKELIKYAIITLFSAALGIGGSELARTDKEAVEDRPERTEKDATEKSSRSGNN